MNSLFFYRCHLFYHHGMVHLFFSSYFSSFVHDFFSFSFAEAKLFRISEKASAFLPFLPTFSCREPFFCSYIELYKYSTGELSIFEQNLNIFFFCYCTTTIPAAAFAAVSSTSLKSSQSSGYVHSWAVQAVLHSTSYKAGGVQRCTS